MDSIKTILHIISKAVAITVVAGIFLSMLNGCSPAGIPDEGKYNVTVRLSGDGTKSLDLNEIGSIVIYAFAGVDDASGTGTLVGYLHETNIDANGIFPMRLTAGGMVDFFVILNPDSEEFSIFDGNDAKVDVTAYQNTTPADIQSWKLKRNPDATSIGQNAKNWKIPMCNLDMTMAVPNRPSRENRRFEITESKNDWQTIPIEVTRAVSKVEVWLWSNDNLPDDNKFEWDSKYSGITGLSLTDPVYRTEMFTGQGTDSDQYIGQNSTSISDNTAHNGFDINDRFKKYVDGTVLYSDTYFRLIWEQYILPNTFFGGNNMGELSGSNSTEATVLNVDYSSYEYEKDSNWKENIKPTKEINLPKSPRNTKIKVWCALNDNTDRSFTYTVVDWDETVTVDIPDFD